MKRYLSGLSFLLVAAPVFAEGLDCAALSNSADAAPPGYSAQCADIPEFASPGRQPSGVIAPGGIAYTVDIRGDGSRLPNTLYKFTLPDFPAQTSRGVTQPSLFALDFSPDGSTLYGISGASAVSNPSTLFSIDTETGAATLIAALSGLTAGDSASGLAIDPVAGIAYFSAAGGSPISSRLYTLDLGTGALSLIGALTAPTDPTGTIFIDIANNCLGDLYGHNISDDALYSINPNTGAATLIGTHGLPANFAQGMDFDNSDGTLYAFIYTGAGTNRFGTFDLTTGAFTTLVQDSPLGEFEGAIPSTCPGSDDIFKDGFELTPR